MCERPRSWNWQTQAQETIANSRSHSIDVTVLNVAKLTKPFYFRLAKAGQILCAVFDVVD